MNDWPFNDPPNAATISLRQIIEGDEPILLVIRDADEGDWQFLTGNELNVADAVVISLANIVSHDPSVIELADLPLGWSATRTAAGQEWHRHPQ